MPRRRVTSIAMVLGVLSLACLLYLTWPEPRTRGPEMTDAERIRACEACLPEGISLDAEFSVSEYAPPPANIYRKNPTTVRAQLLKRGAYCRDGKLYDRDGRRLHFIQEADQIGFNGTFREAYHGQLAEWRKQRDATLAEELRKEPGVVIHMWPMVLPH